jgi:hypothetical protein
MQPQNQIPLNDTNPHLSRVACMKECLVDFRSSTDRSSRDLATDPSRAVAEA